MFNSIFDEINELKYFKKNNCIKNSQQQKIPREKKTQTINLTLSLTEPWPLTGGFFP